MGPRVQGGDLLEESGKSGMRDLAQGTSDRCCFRSIVTVGLEPRGARVVAAEVFCPGDAGCLLQTLGPGASPSGLPPMGDWPLSKLPGALGRPWAEVTAAEFLPGRFPAPPQCLCQGGGREFALARRNVGASPVSTSG